MTDWGRWRADLLAGLSGAVAGAPQAMGFALIAGVNPVYGLYTAVVSTIFGALFGGSTLMTVGPTNALSLVVASTLIGFDGTAQVERLFVLTLLTGVFYLAFSLLRLGFLVRFVSNAVMTGFITGAGLLIIFGQVRHLNGYAPDGATALLKFIDWSAHLHLSDLRTLTIGVGALLVMTGLRFTPLKNLATLIGIGGASLAAIVLGWEGVSLVRDISAVPRGLPLPIIPDVSLAGDLATAALAMAVLGAVQSAAITNAVPKPDDKGPDFRRDLLGMGVGNLVGSLLQGMPACGSLSRTAVNVSAGARSRWANAFAGGFIALTLLLLGSAIEVITLAALGAQLIVAAVSLIKFDEIRAVWRVSFSARAAMMTTLFSTLVLPLEYSIYLGVVLSLLLYLYTSSESITATQLVPTSDGHYQVKSLPPRLLDHQTVLITLHGPLYFGAARRLSTLLPDPSSSTGTIVLLRLRDTFGLGSTAVNALRSYHKALEVRGGRLVLVGVRPEMCDALERAGLITLIGAENLYPANDVVFAATTSALRDIGSVSPN